MVRHCRYSFIKKCKIRSDMFSLTVKQQIEQEFSRGDAARRDGFESRARVCARRAAGVAVREYYRVCGQPVQVSSAYDLLLMLCNDPEISAEMKQVAQRLLERVAVDFSLPSGADLMLEARWLVSELENMRKK